MVTRRFQTGVTDPWTKISVIACPILFSLSLSTYTLLLPTRKAKNRNWALSINFSMARNVQPLNSKKWILSYSSLPLFALKINRRSSETPQINESLDHVNANTAHSKNFSIVLHYCSKFFQSWQEVKIPGGIETDCVRLKTHVKKTNTWVKIHEFFHAIK